VFIYWDFFADEKSTWQKVSTPWENTKMTTKKIFTLHIGWGRGQKGQILTYGADKKFDRG
jgi:hypothetical protein